MFGSCSGCCRRATRAATMSPRRVTVALSGQHFRANVLGSTRSTGDPITTRRSYNMPTKTSNITIEPAKLPDASRVYVFGAGTMPTAIRGREPRSHPGAILGQPRRAAASRRHDRRYHHYLRYRRRVDPWRCRWGWSWGWGYSAFSRAPRSCRGDRAAAAPCSGRRPASARPGRAH